jgi:cyclopropane fatty-acyl-phospholipid synthase-like methyltransferase
MRNPFTKWVIKKIRNTFFPGSALYWERHYSRDGDSGSGSYGRSAEYKADFLNRFVGDEHIQSVIEFGCGDGNQAMQFHFPSYIGLDVSSTAVEKCKEVCKDDPSKQFFVSNKKESKLKAELVLSLDVVYHLIEKEVYETYMNQLFDAATRFVIIYAWDVESDKNYHVKHRKFSEWIKENVPDFKLFNKIKNSTFSDFYIYQRINPGYNKSMKSV